MGGEHEDEQNCVCTDDQFACKDSKGCITHDWVCDFIADCDDKSDEFNCSSTTPQTFSTTYSSQAWPSTLSTWPTLPAEWWSGWNSFWAAIFPNFETNSTAPASTTPSYTTQTVKVRNLYSLNRYSMLHSNVL